MRKFFMVLVFIGFSLHGRGGPVTISGIETAARTFISAVFPTGYNFTAKAIVPVESSRSVFVVNLSPEGWILVSGDDKVIPVLGYSLTGYFDPIGFSSASVDEIIKHYVRSIESASRDGSLKRNALWDGGYAMKKSVSGIVVDPLIPVTWDQDKNWNIFCPADAAGPGGHSYVGCVGVCMAQAMSYYRYPAKATGDKTYFHSTYGTIILHYDMQSPYEWDSMSLNTPDRFNSQLLYHCAVSVGMDFGADGSSAQTKNIPSSLVKYFKYFNGVRYVARYASDSAWTSLLNNELDAGRPVIYSGFPEDNTPGHAFDIDGVDGRGYYHLNWGWTGKYNAWYLIDNLRPGTYSFTRDQGAVINIRPPVYSPYDLALTKTTVKERLPAGSYVGRLKISDEAPDNQYVLTLQGDSIEPDTYLEPDFYMSHDTLRTQKEFLYNERNNYTLYIKAEDQFGHIYREKFMIEILVNSIPTDISDDQANVLTIYPNPSEGVLTIKDPEKLISAIELISIQGNVLLSLQNEQFKDLHTIRYSRAGIYFLRMTLLNKKEVLKKVVIF